MPGVKSRLNTAIQELWPNGRNMGESGTTSRELEERARKREAIGLPPRRPTARTVIHSPPEARRTFPVTLLAIVVLAAIAITAVLWRPVLPSFRPDPPEMELGRLIVRDDFSEPKFPLTVDNDQDSDQRYLGDLYRMQVTRPGVRVWATLGQLNLGAYRFEADLRLATQEAYAWGYGGLIARYQNDQNFYLFVIDNQGEFQIELAENGVWRTIRPWTKTHALSNGRQNVLSVADNGAELRFYINANSVDVVADPRHPPGDVGLVVGTRSRGQGQGLFDWVALYEISTAE